MNGQPRPATLPPGVVSPADYDVLARERLDDAAWAYFSGGAGDEITVEANRQAWQRLWLHPRVLQPLAGGHTRVELLGRSLAHPVMLAPVAYQRLAHADGEIGTALAAAAQGAGLVLSLKKRERIEVDDA